MEWITFGIACGLIGLFMRSKFYENYVRGKSSKSGDINEIKRSVDKAKNNSTILIVFCIVEIIYGIMSML